VGEVAHEYFVRCDIVPRGGIDFMPLQRNPDFYARQPEYIEALSAFVRSRPSQPVDAA